MLNFTIFIPIRIRHPRVGLRSNFDYYARPTEYRSAATMYITIMIVTNRFFFRKLLFEFYFDERFSIRLQTILTVGLTCSGM